MKVKLINENCYISKGHISDAGWDLRATDKTIIKPFETAVINTGVCIEIPEGYSGDIRPRSSMNIKGLLTHYGTVDVGYTGEIKVAITNLTNEDYVINQYERMAQLVINKINGDNNIEFVDELSRTERGNSGFGSTGR